MRKFYLDEDGSLLVEQPEHSGTVVGLDSQVLYSVAAKFGRIDLAEIEESYQELVPKVDFTGWAHYSECVTCPRCGAWIPVGHDIPGILTAIAAHVCKPKNPNPPHFCYCDEDNNVPHLHVGVTKESNSGT